MVNPNIFREITSRVTMMADSIKVAPPIHTATRETLRNLAWMAANMALRLQLGTVAVRKAAPSARLFRNRRIGAGGLFGRCHADDLADRGIPFLGALRATALGPTL